MFSFVSRHFGELKWRRILNLVTKTDYFQFTWTENTWHLKRKKDTKKEDEW